MVKALLPFSTIDAQDEGGRSPLALAVLARRKQTAEYLLGNRADAFTRDCDGRTLLHHAAAVGDEVLIEHFGHLYRQRQQQPVDEEGTTALHLAVKREQPVAVQTLLRLDVEVNYQDRQGRTALMVAVHKNRPDLVRLLVQHQPSGERTVAINAINESGNTALHIAAILDRAECARLLVEAGASTSIRNKRGDTPIEAIRRHRPPERSMVFQEVFRELEEREEQQ